MQLFSETWPHQKRVSPTDNLLIAFPFLIPWNLLEIVVPYGHLDIPDPCFTMIECFSKDVLELSETPEPYAYLCFYLFSH